MSGAGARSQLGRGDLKNALANKLSGQGIGHPFAFDAPNGAVPRGPTVLALTGGALGSGENAALGNND